MSAVGLGDDINAIIRVCPPPRDGESEACEASLGCADFILKSF